jgi:hypothetical protein
MRSHPDHTPSGFSARVTLLVIAEEAWQTRSIIRVPNIGHLSLPTSEKPAG